MGGTDSSEFPEKKTGENGPESDVGPALQSNVIPENLLVEIDGRGN